jgi:hypothetical protein
LVKANVFSCPQQLQNKDEKKSNSSFKIGSAQHVGGSKTGMLGQKELKLTDAALSQAEVVIGLKSSRH